MVPIYHHLIHFSFWCLLRHLLTLANCGFGNVRLHPAPTPSFIVTSPPPHSPYRGVEVRVAANWMEKAASPTAQLHHPSPCLAQCPLQVQGHRHPPPCSVCSIYVYVFTSSHSSFSLIILHISYTFLLFHLVLQMKEHIFSEV
jgi:hypothetical protein